MQPEKDAEARRQIGASVHRTHVGHKLAICNLLIDIIKTLGGALSTFHYFNSMGPLQPVHLLFDFPSQGQWPWAYIITRLDSSYRS